MAAATSIQLRQLHSLVKVFAESAPPTGLIKGGNCLAGETYSYQVAYTTERPWSPALTLRVEGDLAAAVELREVGLVASEYLGESMDEHVVKTAPGLFPDVLLPINEPLRVIHGQWRSVWVTVRVPKNTKASTYQIKTIWENAQGTWQTSFDLEVLAAALPAARLDHTEWFHTDCISTYYNIEVWSAAHWKLLKFYFANCAAHGQNMLLTPVFTPPLDTAIGGERPTVQLVGMSYAKGVYSFDFSLLKKWIKLAQSQGIEKFEIAHLFSQWGAGWTPKIIVNGKKKFGWHVAADSKAYKEFLNQFLPALTALLDKLGLREKTVFHVSDEPGEQSLAPYERAANLVRPLLQGYKIIDALSNISFYNKGLVLHPVPASNHIEPFVEAGVSELWTYYCTSQWNLVSNRFFHMDSARNRIMGFLLFKYKIAGFLHWGYNFWYTRFSIKAIDPFKVTDAGKAFQSGDSFMVYPGAEGPLDSIRHEVFYEAQQDLRACQALEEKIGYAKVIQLLESGLAEPLSMKQYPRQADWILKKRSQINQRLL